MELVAYQTAFVIIMLCHVTTGVTSLYIFDDYYPNYNTQQLVDEPQPMNTKRSEVAPENVVDEWLRGESGDTNHLRLMNLMRVARRGGNFPFHFGRSRLTSNNIVPFYSHRDGINYFGYQGNAVPRPGTDSKSLYGLWARPYFGRYSSVKRKYGIPDYL